MKASREAWKHFKPHAHRQTLPTHSPTLRVRQRKDVLVWCSDLPLSLLFVSCLSPAAWHLSTITPSEVTIWTLVSNFCLFEMLYVFFAPSRTVSLVWSCFCSCIAPSCAFALAVFLQCLLFSSTNIFYHQCCWSYLLSLTVETTYFRRSCLALIFTHGFSPNVAFMFRIQTSMESPHST